MSNLQVKSNSKKKTIYNGIIDIKYVNVVLPELVLEARNKDNGVGGNMDIAEFDASSSIPDGYEILAVLPCSTASNQVYNYYIENRSKTIMYQYRNVAYTQQTITPVVKLLLIKRNTE